MDTPPYKLSLEGAEAVLGAIREVCVFREWPLIAAHVRPTHVHCVVANVAVPHRAIADFKAYASRRLNAIEGSRKRWARDGSTRPLLNEDAVRTAVRYVADRQGDPIAVYVDARQDDGALQKRPQAI